MNNKNKKPKELKHSSAKSASETTVTFIGYFWITFSFIIAIWQLIDFLFKPPSFQLNNYIGWIIGASVLIISVGIAVLLTHFFPSILEVIDNFDIRKEEEKFFKISQEEEKDYFSSIIFESLPYIDDDRFILASLKKSCLGITSEDNVSEDIKPNYEKAVNIGRVNGTLLYRLGKNYLRVLNGLYALYAVEKWRPQRKRRYVYYKNYFIINDIGWSLTELSDYDYSELEKFVLHSNEGQLIYKTIKDIVEIDFNQNARYNGKHLINLAREELENYNLPKLYAQAIRHSLSLDLFSDVYSILKHDFETTIKRIKNKNDRSEMRANLKFIEAVKVYKKAENVSSAEIDKALENLEIAQKEYTKIKDTARAVKCYNLHGKLYLMRNAEQEATEKFKTGLKESKIAQRYDEVLRNLESLVRLEKNPETKLQNAREGLKLAIELKNSRYEDIFNGFAPIKHIFIIRHGESEKNLKKTISGEGALTEIGKNQIIDKCKNIKSFLKVKGYSSKDIRIYGIHKQQIKESMNLIIDQEKISDDNVFFDDDLLKPLHMGILTGTNESESEQIDKSTQQNNDESAKRKKALIALNQWRNGMISAQGLTVIKDIEPFDSYWKRAKTFINNRIKDDIISIIVCTTSTAVFLTQYLLNPNMTDAEYYCLDIPLGAVIHFTDIPNKKEYRLVNKDTRTNILYSSIQSNNQVTGGK